MRTIILVLIVLILCGCEIDTGRDLVGAIIRDDASSVREMLSKGEDPNKPSHEDLIPIMVATGSTNPVSDKYAHNSNKLKENVEILKMLLKSGANANYRDKSGRTPLLNAVYHGRLHSVSLLLDFGANPDAVSEVGFTPLMYAAEHCMPEIARELVVAGADAKIKSPEGETAVEMARRLECANTNMFTAPINETPTATHR
jgi:ankyrin repeat protein